MYLELDLAYSTALSIKALYSGFCDACKINEGLVVASVGRYCFITEIKGTNNMYL